MANASIQHPHPQPIVKPADIDEEYGQDVESKPELFSKKDRAHFLRVARENAQRAQEDKEEGTSGLEP